MNYPPSFQEILLQQNEWLKEYLGVLKIQNDPNLVHQQTQLDSLDFNKRLLECQKKQ